MDQEQDLIKEQMEETRVSLTDKVEQLEDTLLGTVQHTLHTASDVVENVTETVEQTVETVKETVQGSVEAVKETVHETVETVKQAFDLRGHVQRHPWAMLAGSVVLGFLGGRMLSGARRWRQDRRSRREALAGTGMGTYSAPMPAAAPARAREPEPPPPEAEQRSWMGQLGDTFGAEIGKLKGLALGATFGLLRDMVTRSVPDEMKSQLADVFNDVTTKLGGKVIQGPLVDMASDESHEGEGHNGRHDRSGVGTAPR
jgi:ElaB/YqjD/DUF883 family membrane-anchored ribosome-binding protein